MTNNPESNKTREDYLKEAKRQEQNRLIKRVLLWGGVTVAIIAMVWGLAKLGSSTAPVSGGATLVDPVTDSDWVRGNKLATATLVEYSDLQCPACAAVEPTVRRIMQDFGTKLRIVYRHFPLMQHPYAEEAARAAEAAGLQGKFWEMHDVLFDEQPTWSAVSDIDATLLAYAERLGLDKTKFQTDYNSSTVAQKVAANAASGGRSNIASTPTFFLNGQQLQPQSFADLYDAVAAALK